MKTMQPGLALEFPTQTTDPMEAALRYVTRGQPVVIRMDMTVCEMHQLWDDLWFRGHDAAGKLENFAETLRERIKQTESRAEKQRLGRVANRTDEFVHVFSGIAEGEFADAQEQLAKILPDDAEEFWQDVGDRPGIEHTWSMTLQQVLNKYHS